GGDLIEPSLVLLAQAALCACLDCFDSPSRSGAGRGVGVDAAVLAAAAEPAAGDADDVSAFACHARRAMHHPSVDNTAGADACAECEGDEVADAGVFAGACPILAKGGGVGVVFKDAGPAGELAHGFFDGDVGP